MLLQGFPGNVLSGFGNPRQHRMEGTLDIDGFQDALFGADGRQGVWLAKALQGQSTA